MIYLKYENLNDLIFCSDSSRKYFLSLPADMQMQLHEHNEYIHSAAELRARVNLIEKYNHITDISKSFNFKKRK